MLCEFFIFFLMIQRPPRSTRTYPLFPYTTLFRSMRFVQGIVDRADGSVKSSYTMPSEADIYAQANAGETAYPVPLGTLDSLPYDLTALRDQKKQEINDAAAEYGPGVEAARMSAIQAIDEIGRAHV